jgi:DNA polymerase III gamma/tau subunit
MIELYKKYRPKLFKEIIGQDEAVEQMKEWIKTESTPHTILFSGPTGVGKTSAAHIMAKKLKCFKHNKIEVNAASSRGVDEARNIERNMRAEPLSGGSLVWIIDEAHKLTGDAQNALLKPLEDTPNWVYFMLASSVPNKLLKTIRGRCTELAFRGLSPDQIRGLLQYVCVDAKLNVFEDVLDKISEIADGSARKALVVLQQAATTKDEEKQMAIVMNSICEKEAFELWKALVQRTPSWGKISAVLRDIKKRKDDAEGIRQLIMACATTKMIDNHKDASRGADILNHFRDHYYENGINGLTLSCWEYVFSK